jgi:hypothetical protein
MADGLKEAGDVQLECEKQLIALLRSRLYDTFIGDPLIHEIPAAKSLAFYALPHTAISSRLFWDNQPLCATPAFDCFVERIVADCSARAVTR